MSGEFSRYPVSPETIWGHADSVSAVAGDVEQLGDNIHNIHQRAQQGVAGLLEQPMVAAEQPVAGKVSRWLQSAVFAGGAIRRFGDAVYTYNTGIDDLNRRWQWAAQNHFGVPAPHTTGVTSSVEESRILTDFHDQVAVARRAYWLELERERVSVLEAALDEAAQEVAGLLDAGPEDEKSVLTLFQAGALPTAAPLVFTQVRFDTVDPALLYTNLINSGRMPDVASMSDEELDRWLRNHPDAADQLAVVLLLTGPLTTEQERVARAIGRYDAWVVERGLEMPPGRPGLDQITTGSVRLVEINARFAETGSMTEAEQAYLHAWYDGLGADNLAALPAYVDDALRVSYAGVDQATLGTIVASSRSHYLSPIADGIMNLSHEAGSMKNMPQAIQDLANTEIGHLAGDRVGDLRWPALDEHGTPLFDRSDPPDFTVAGLARYGGFVSLLETSTVEGSVVFTRELGESALRVKQDLNAIAANTSEVLRWGPHSQEDYDALRLATLDDEVSRMLAVVARNEDAAGAMLVNHDSRPLLLGLNWYDDHGVVEIIRAGTSRDADGDGHMQAAATLALIQELGGDRDFYLERMTDDMQAAVVDTGIQWLDMLSRPAMDDSPSDWGTFKNIFDESVVGFQLSNDDRDRFLEFIAGTGDENAMRFRGAAVVHSEEQVARALQTGDWTTVELALAAAGRLDGAITRADVSYLQDQLGEEYDEALVAHEAEVRRNNGFQLAASVAWSVGSTGLGAATGGSSAFLTAAAGPLVSGFISDILDAGPPPQDQTADTLNELFDADRLDHSMERNYFLLSAYERAGISAADDYPELYRRDGTLRPLSELASDSRSSNYLQDLQRAEASSREQLIQTYPGYQNIDVGRYGEERNSVHNQSSYQRYQPTGQWTDDATARQRLYGERYVGDGEAPGRGYNEPRWTADPDDYYQPPWADRS